MATKFLGTDRARAMKELLRVYKVLGKPFTRKEFDEVSKISSRTVERVFGTWTEGLEAAGLHTRFAQHAAVEKEKKAFQADSVVDKKWEEDRVKLLQKANERKDRWLRAQVQKLDTVREMILESVAKAPPIMVKTSPIKPRAVKSSLGNLTLWFEFSDLQLGTLITSEEMGGLNKHNWIIWQEKLKIWVREAIRIIADYRDQGYTIDRVVVAMLGDMVEGHDIFAGQVWQIDRHTVDQCILGAQDTAGAFAEVFGAFPDVPFEVFEVFGNHGRTGKKGVDPFSCSFDKIYQRMVEMQLGKAGALSNVTWHQNEAWFYLVEVYGWNHLLLHGDQGMAGLWSNRPTVNGLEKGLSRYNQMLQQPVHFLHCGHFHNEWGLSFNMSYMLINGSWIGASKFSAAQMVAASPPMQTVHAFCPRVGLLRTERIHLAEGDVRKPLEPKRLKR